MVPFCVYGCFAAPYCLPICMTVRHVWPLRRLEEGVLSIVTRQVGSEDSNLRPLKEQPGLSPSEPPLQFHLRAS